MSHKPRYFCLTFHIIFWPAADEGSMPADIATLLKTSMGLWEEKSEFLTNEEIQLGALKDIHITVTMGFMSICNFL